MLSRKFYRSTYQFLRNYNVACPSSYSAIIGLPVKSYLNCHNFSSYINVTQSSLQSRSFTTNVDLVSPNRNTSTISEPVVEGTTSAVEAYVLHFTCNKCNTRSAKRFSKKSYHHGVVIIRCSTCRHLHLIADNLGWFDDKPCNIETLLKEQGQDVIKQSLETEVFSIENDNSTFNSTLLQKTPKDTNEL